MESARNMRIKAAWQHVEAKLQAQDTNRESGPLSSLCGRKGDLKKHVPIGSQSPAADWRCCRKVQSSGQRRRRASRRSSAFAGGPAAVEARTSEYQSHA
eukprot:6214649-Pleurochrysis_carterae.AAC.3